MVFGFGIYLHQFSKPTHSPHHTPPAIGIVKTNSAFTCTRRSSSAVAFWACSGRSRTPVPFSRACPCPSCLYVIHPHAHTRLPSRNSSHVTTPPMDAICEIREGASIEDTASTYIWWHYTVAHARTNTRTHTHAGSARGTFTRRANVARRVGERTGRVPCGLWRVGLLWLCAFALLWGSTKQQCVYVKAVKAYA
jgi:hypothetical protein